MILEDPTFDFRYIRLCDLDIPREKRVIYLQTVEILIRHCILQHLIYLHCLPITLLGVSRLQWVYCLAILTSLRERQKRNSRVYSREKKEIEENEVKANDSRETEEIRTCPYPQYTASTVGPYHHPTKQKLELTVFTLSIQTPQLLTILALKFVQVQFITQCCI